MSNISVIIPVFNRPAPLRLAVESALGQTLRPREILIVDDGSTDDTPEVIRGLCRDHPGLVRACRIANSGPGAAREAGRLMAVGEFIQYLDSDDLLAPRKLETQSAALLAHPDAAAAYGSIEVKDRRGATVSKRADQALDRILPGFLLGSWWPTHAPLWRRELVEPVGAWLPLWIFEDWEYDCRVGARGHPIVFVPGIMGEMRDYGRERLSHARRFDRKTLRQRATALSAITGHVQSAGLAPGLPEVRHFASRLFMVARECAAVGFVGDARRLFEESGVVAGSPQALGTRYRAFGMLAGALGWRLAGCLSVIAENVVPRGNPGR